MEFTVSIDWLITVIICGVLGGLGALIGGLLARAGFKWAKFVPVVFVIAGFPVSHLLIQPVSQQGTTPAAIGQALKSGDPEMFALLEKAFPEDFKDLTTAIADTVKAGGTEKEVSKVAGEKLLLIQKSYLRYLGQAGDAAQASLIDGAIRIHEELFKRGWMLCNIMALQGPDALQGQTDPNAVAAITKTYGQLVLQAAADGKEKPVARRKPTQADQDNVLRLMEARGITIPQFKAYADKDVNSPDLCPALIGLLKTLNASDDEGVKAVRAAYLNNAT